MSTNISNNSSISKNSKEEFICISPLLKSTSANRRKKSIRKKDEIIGKFSPSTFRQKYLAKNRCNFEVDELNFYNNDESSAEDFVPDFSQICSYIFVKSKPVKKSNIEVEDSIAYKDHNSEKILTTGRSLAQIEFPDKLSSYKKSNKYSGMSIRIEDINQRNDQRCNTSIDKHLIAASAKKVSQRLAKGPSNYSSPELRIGGGAEISKNRITIQVSKPTPFQSRMADSNGKVTAEQIKLAMIERIKILKETSLSEPTENDLEKSSFSEVSEMKRSPFTDQAQLTSRSALIREKLGDSFKKRKSGTLKEISQLSEVKEVSFSNEISNSLTFAQSNLYLFSFIYNRNILFGIGIFLVFAEILLLLYLSDN